MEICSIMLFVDSHSVFESWRAVLFPTFWLDHVQAPGPTADEGTWCTRCPAKFVVLKSTWLRPAFSIEENLSSWFLCVRTRCVHVNTKSIQIHVHIYVYIYIYMCVDTCLCVLVHADNESVRTHVVRHCTLRGMCVSNDALLCVFFGITQ